MNSTPPKSGGPVSAEVLADLAAANWALLRALSGRSFGTSAPGGKYGFGEEIAGIAGLNDKLGRDIKSLYNNK